MLFVRSLGDHSAWARTSTQIVHTQTELPEQVSYPGLQNPVTSEPRVSFFPWPEEQGIDSTGTESSGGKKMACCFSAAAGTRGSQMLLVILLGFVSQRKCLLSLCGSSFSCRAPFSGSSLAFLLKLAAQTHFIFFFQPLLPDKLPASVSA